jgi:hypothetical protein
MEVAMELDFEVDKITESIENAEYFGVCGNLTAYGCKVSMECGFDGVVAFDPKTALIPHYEKTLGAVLISERRMVIFEDKAKLLIDKYFPEMGVL